MMAACQRICRTARANIVFCKTQRIAQHSFGHTDSSRTQV
jgi:hypothetical protein